MSARRDRTGNLLGALSLVITDRTSDAVAEAAGRSDSAAAALSALLQFLDRPTVDLLRQVLGLTSSGAVRLLDRLEAEGYVKRGPGPDRRSTSVRLTARGRRAAERVTAARGQVLSDALATLSDQERESLAQLTSRILVGLMRGPGAVRWMCRMCDMEACGRPIGQCPVANETARRYA